MDLGKDLGLSQDTGICDAADLLMFKFDKTALLVGRLHHYGDLKALQAHGAAGSAALKAARMKLQRS